ncbi:MAG: hypothetical protein ACFE94_15355 [Candidatus Hodarchaeota archaeon]
MGLDKWLKTEEEVEKEKKIKAVQTKSTKHKRESEQISKTKSLATQLVKYILVCPNAKCKYQKTIMKKQLSEKDRICPRCNKEMKVKK